MDSFIYAAVQMTENVMNRKTNFQRLLRDSAEAIITTDWSAGRMAVESILKKSVFRLTLEKAGKRRYPTLSLFDLVFVSCWLDFYRQAIDEKNMVRPWSPGP